MAKNRNDRRGPRRAEWSDDAPSGFEEPSFFSRRPQAPRVDSSDAVEATVLWFDANKGFGFVQPAEGEKAFLHVRQVEAAGISSLGEGTTLRVVIEPGPKGPSVTSITELLATAQAASSSRPNLSPRHASPSGALEEASGIVKFYNAEKGFGFIGRDDGGKDIFVHATVLRGAGLTELTEGQAVVVQFALGAKGPEAKSIKLA